MNFCVPRTTETEKGELTASTKIQNRSPYITGGGKERCKEETKEGRTIKTKMGKNRWRGTRGEGRADRDSKKVMGVKLLERKAIKKLKRTQVVRVADGQTRPIKGKGQGPPDQKHMLFNGGRTTSGGGKERNGRKQCSFEGGLP